MSWVTVFQTEDPDLCWETNEFVVQHNTLTGQWRYGSDGGCSCYMGFDESEFSGTYNISVVQQAFGTWVASLNNPARHWEEFMDAKRTGMTKPI